MVSLIYLTIKLKLKVNLLAAFYLFKIEFFG